MRPRTSLVVLAALSIVGLGSACNQDQAITPPWKFQTPFDAGVDAAPNCTPGGQQPDGDRDGDGVANPDDNCPCTGNPQQADDDNDGIGNVCDNCPTKPNPGQADADACDTCPHDNNCKQNDSDDDGTGDVCESEGPRQDSDGDGTDDRDDNCPSTPNPNQGDRDGDGIGDACDNCRDTPNGPQKDSDDDGTGDVCEPEPSGPICKRVGKAPKFLKPNFFIALDSSGSMHGEKIHDAQQALDKIADRFHDVIRFGFMDWSSSSDCPGDFHVDLQTGNHSKGKLKNAWGSVTTNGGTAMGEALYQISDKCSPWNNHPDALYNDPGDPRNGRRKKAVLFISDGQSTVGRGQCSNEFCSSSQCTHGMCDVPEAAARYMHDNNDVQTYAVGFTDSADMQQLNKIAQEGGTSTAYTADNTAQLVNAIDSALQRFASCKYTINAPSDQKIWVEVDGKIVDSKNWDYDAQKNELTLAPSTCQQAGSSNQPKPVQVIMGCPSPCADN